jgi:hypothetical protein
MAQKAAKEGVTSKPEGWTDEEWAANTLERIKQCVVGGMKNSSIKAGAIEAH